MGQQGSSSHLTGHSGQLESRWMALDVGEKTIGVAITDPLRITVRPLLTLSRRELKADAEAVADLIRRYEVGRLIVGLPRHLDGQPSQTSRHIRPLVRAIQSRTSIPLNWCDERLSTREAERLMADRKIPIRERRKKRNEYAAALILRWFLQEEEKRVT